MKDEFKNRLNQALGLRNMKASELAEKTGMHKSRISQYVNGIYEAKQEAVYKIALALDVSESWLMGYDVPIERLEPKKYDEEIKTIAAHHAGNEWTEEELYEIEKFKVFVRSKRK